MQFQGIFSQWVISNKTRITTSIISVDHNYKTNKIKDNGQKINVISPVINKLTTTKILIICLKFCLLLVWTNQSYKYKSTHANL